MKLDHKEFNHGVSKSPDLIEAIEECIYESEVSPFQTMEECIYGLEVSPFQHEKGGL